MSTDAGWFFDFRQGKSDLKTCAGVALNTEFSVNLADQTMDQL